MTGAMSFIGGIRNLALSGVLTTTDSVSPVTSASRTIQGNGTFLFNGVVAGPGTPQYNLAAAGWNNITEGMTLAVTDGQSFQTRAALPTPADQSQYTLRNNANSKIIETVFLTRS